MHHPPGVAARDSSQGGADILGLTVLQNKLKKNNVNMLILPLRALNMFDLKGHSILLTLRQSEGGKIGKLPSATRKMCNALVKAISRSAACIG